MTDHSAGAGEILRENGQHPSTEHCPTSEKAAPGAAPGIDPDKVYHAPEPPRPIDPAFWNRSLFEALLDTRTRFGRDHVALEDAEGQVLTLDKMVLAATILGRKLEALTEPGEHVGVMLPNVAGVAATFFGLQSVGRIPAMLNFSAGLRNLQAACTAAAVETIVTSRRFVELAGLDDVVTALGHSRRIIWLEDVRATIGTLDKVGGLLRARFGEGGMRRKAAKPEDVAVILFTSGSEGLPKGVALTHANVLANAAQAIAYFDLNEDDRIFNPLPVFHSFGLTIGLMLPLFAGIMVELYPSPLHYKQIPGALAKSKSTILIGTDTFAGGWGRIAKPDEMRSLRLVVLGAERVREQTRELWHKKFGVDLFEGYGVTETSPVLACNKPTAQRIGTVGRLFPKIEAHLTPVPGLPGCGRLIVRGPNVMAGYYRIDNPGVLEPCSGEHDTGDIVSIDADGFVAIRGRARRFAKVGGEMISLAAVEAFASTAWPDAAHAVVNLPDPKKGETLVLVTDQMDADRETLVQTARAQGISELMIPKRIVAVDGLPVLATGKLDYLGIQEIAKDV
ncbi:MAG: 2-acylglycerophosphoethanolamine acyltransferase [Hyphomicrobiales bacterium]|nr:MAG: 2-acylglycerophosphoethanolamine acyltransferase [Hyphomicrobiales bacterium]